MAETEQAPDPLIGRLVGQKFRVDRLLGQGAMGRVYLAEQTNLGKQIALKVLHNAMAGDAQLAKRFYREAKSASMLAHPNILQIIDFGDDDGLLFIAMELLNGRDLYRTIKMDWPFSLERIGHIGSQILSALDEAHDKGVVHRDLKPENVMLMDVRGEPDFVKVCDFGIAKVASERDGEGSAITVAGMVCGTPEYMSPEQARGEPLDGRSDLYAMATILYQMVAGDVPFRAESALGVITKQLHENPVPPSQRRANVSCPPALEQVILRGLHKSREARFANAGDMKLALLEAVGMRRSSSNASVARAGGGGLTDVALAATGVSTPVSTPATPAFAATAPQAMTPASTSAVGAAHSNTSAPAASSPGVAMSSSSTSVPAARSYLPIVIGLVAVVGGVGVGAYLAVSRAKPAAATQSSSSAAPPSVAAPSSIVAAPPPVAAPPAPPAPPTRAVDKAQATPIPNAPAALPQQVFAAATPHKREKHAAAKPSSGQALAAAETRPVAAGGLAVAETRPAAAGGLSAAPSVGAVASSGPTSAKPTAGGTGAHTFAAAFADAEQLFRAGDVEGALARYQEAARLNPSDAKTQRQIVKCYNRLGQQDRAIPYIKRYLELAPDASDAAFFRAQLDGK